MHAKSTGLVCAVVGALGFSFKAIFVKAAYRYGVDAETLLALRMLYALPLFLLLGLMAARHSATPISAADWRALAVLGMFGYYASSYLDFLGLRHISAALERVILFVNPSIVVLFTGLHDLRFGGAQVLLGGSLVFASAVCFAIYLLRAGSLLTRLGSAPVAAWATAIACVLVIAQFLLLRPVTALAMQPWQVQVLSAAMAVFSTVLPIWLVSEAMRRLGAAPTAMIGSLGPVITMLMAWLWLGEPLGILQLLGATLVIFGVRLVATTAPNRAEA